MPESSRRFSFLKNSESPLDEALLRELDDADRPEASPLTEDEVQRHAAAIRREEQALIRREGRTRMLSRRAYQICSVLTAVIIIGILLLNILDLPVFGREDNPTNNEVSGRYLESGLEEGGAVNLVADVILDYRAFDTLGESNVLFAAACAVILLLRYVEQGEAPASGAPQPSVRPDDVPPDPILQASARLLVPVILLFGCYVILNGHLNPGGGFAGGAVLGAGLILQLNAFGGARGLSFRFYRGLTAGALSFYALSKAWAFFAGANGLNSGISPGVPGNILSGGLILPLNIAVGLVVCCTVYAFFTLFRKGAF